MNEAEIIMRMMLPAFAKLQRKGAEEFLDALNICLAPVRGDFLFRLTGDGVDLWGTRDMKAYEMKRLMDMCLPENRLGTKEDPVILTENNLLYILLDMISVVNKSSVIETGNNYAIISSASVLRKLRKADVNTGIVENQGESQSDFIGRMSIANSTLSFYRNDMVPSYWLRGGDEIHDVATTIFCIKTASCNPYMLAKEQIAMAIVKVESAEKPSNKQKPILVQNPPGVWEWKAMFRAKLISSLYAEFSKRHPEASTDYEGTIERLGDTVSIRPKPKLGAFQIFINLVISHEVVFPYPDPILRTRDAIEAEECIGEVIAKLCLPTSPIKAFAAQIIDNGETYSIVWGVLAEPNTVKPPLEVQSRKDKQCRDCAYWAKDVPDIIHRKPCLLPSEAKSEMPKVLTHATYSCPDWKRVEVES
jgi:hypothetical protein